MNCIHCGTKLILNENWYQSNKIHHSYICNSCSRKKNKKWRKSHPLKNRAFSIKSDARVRKLEFKLTQKEIYSLITKPCYYCGELDNLNGIDRLNNSKGYINGNCVSCCKTCNLMKRNMTEQEFKNKCKKITEVNDE